MSEQTLINFREQNEFLSSIPLIPIQALEFLNPKTALTIVDLVRNTNKRTRSAALNCTSKEVQSDLKRLAWAYHTTCQGGNKKGHVQHFKILPKYKKGKIVLEQNLVDIVNVPFYKLHIGVRCTCPAFVYWVSEYLAFKYGYSYGKPQGTNNPPEVRFRFQDGSSTTRSFVCKHIASAARLFVRKKLITKK